MGKIQNSAKSMCLHKKFVSRCLQSEIKFFQFLLEDFEKLERPEDLHLEESLKLSAINIKDLVNQLS